MPESKAAGGIFSVITEFILYIFVDIILYVICFYVGFLFVRLITLGKSPEYPHDNETGFSILGMCILLGPPFVYLLWIS